LVLSCALGLALVSLLDDLNGLPVAARLSAHAVAALLAMAVLVPLRDGAPATYWLAWLFALGAVAWMTNLYNFMDGADGLAGTMAAIGFGAYAWAASQAGQASLAIACLAIASASVGFLAYNFPPARVFMGDAGSIPVGFLAGALGVQGFAADAWDAAFPVLVFSPFIVDASVTLLRRLSRRERVWQAHRSHYYQRLVLAGWNPRRLLFAAGGLMLAAAASALVVRGADAMLRCGIIFFWVAFYALLLPAIDRKTRTMTAAAR
jgi:UDP-N-acetylmuramyl pentapeptide phosphotransferase/UDP-N-acetylglucosamine-1-phosphate transferase